MRLSDGNMPYIATPALAAVKPRYEQSIIAALFSQCITGNFIPRAPRVSIMLRKSPTCLSLALLSCSSAVARCVNIPSMCMLGSLLIFSISSAAVPSGSKPILLMPVSIFICSSAVCPIAEAIRDTSSAKLLSYTVIRISFLTASAILPHGIKPSVYIGFLTPLLRSCSASSAVAAAYASAMPLSASATCAAPCPYASAFTTAMNFSPRGIFSRSSFALCTILSRSTSAYTRQYFSFASVSVISSHLL